jgi:Zn finger protein HypA/HybF involved in hydrogenase expression
MSLITRLKIAVEKITSLGIWCTDCGTVLHSYYDTYKDRSYCPNCKEEK